jgi:hypothetical protein
MREKNPTDRDGRSRGARAGLTGSQEAILVEDGDGVGQQQQRFHNLVQAHGRQTSRGAIRCNCAVYGRLFAWETGRYASASPLTAKGTGGNDGNTRSSDDNTR